MKSVLAAAALVIAAAAAVAFVLTRHADAGPDPYAGGYPLVTPAPVPTGSPAPTWRPTGIPAGPLPVFRGTRSKVAGRITDRVAGVSYVRFAAPWRLPRVVDIGTSGGQILDGGRTGGLGNYWYVAVYSGLLPVRFSAAAPRPQALRAGAELYGQHWATELYSDQGRRTELAGQPLTVQGHRGWLTAFRMTHTDATSRVEKSQTEVVVTVDTGRRTPAVVTVTVPGNKNLLPDINLVVRSLRVIR